jgi:thioredoxin reductase/bacterioferritin-associated ferredoxin
MKAHYDLVIIGDGPAGMAAAIQAAKHGLSVLTIGEQPAPGGQIYRHIEDLDPHIAQILGPDYASGESLAQDFHQAVVDSLHGTTVWHIQAEPGTLVSYASDHGAGQVRSQRIILATGARERPVPIPGWTLPGVMAATAADILLKSNHIIPERGTVLAGSGPLLLLVANHLISAGASLQAILDTTPLGNYFNAVKYLPQATLDLKTLIKGIRMQGKIRLSGIPLYRIVTNLEALGDDSLEGVRFQSAGRTREIKTRTLFLHNGLVPDTQMTFLVDCEHAWDPVQRYWRPVTDAWGNTSVAGVGIAGDAAGIAGAAAAEISGALAGLEAASALKRISEHKRDRIARPLRKKLARETRIRPFLDHLYQPSPDLLVPRDEKTLVCRCEQVTVEQVREALASGLSRSDQVKALTRCGMGPCQGRLCGLTLAEIMADYNRVDIASLDYFHIRPPVKPITLGQLAGMQLAGPLEDADEIR